MTEKLNSCSGNDLEIWELHMQGSTVCCPENETNKKKSYFHFRDEVGSEKHELCFYVEEGYTVLSIRLQSHSSFILKLLICAAFCLPLCLWQTLDCVGTIGFI